MDNTTEAVCERLSHLDDFIAYLENTGEHEWNQDRVRNSDNTKNCVMGHLVNWYYGKDYEGDVSAVWDIFEEMWSTTFYIYDVNDGRSENYQQPTPKQRILAYLKDLWMGLRTPTWKAWDLMAASIDIDAYERNLVEASP